MLVRSEKRVEPALGPLQVDLSKVEVTEGDVTDRESVRAALCDMDAIIHAASVFTLDKRKSNEIIATNRKGAEIVLGESCDAGLDPVVHVSSVAAILSSGEGSRVSHNSSPTSSRVGAYVDSKAQQEIIARDFQSMGCPVVITYPGAVMGPHDPHWGDGPLLVESILDGKTRITVEGHMPIVDVRDIASLHSSIMEPGNGPRRFMLSGTVIPLTEITSLLGRLAGRNIRTTAVPIWMVSPVVKLLDSMYRVVPFRLPVSNEGFTILKWDLSFDDSMEIDRLGIEMTDLETTMADMVRWMHSTGRISDQVAGQLTS
jgi:nucleoside-diphosphate-sugar epimerase